MTLYSNIANISFPSNPNIHYYEYQSIPYPTYLNDVVAVLDSVKKLFSLYFNTVDDKPLSIINQKPNIDAPQIVYEINTIYLNVSGRYWCQYIYQFSHEFCHCMNWGHVVQPMRWFEESLCELASHFFLLKSYEKWKVDPPYPNWKDYAENILNYEISSKTDVSNFNIIELFDSKSAILQSLEKDEYQRSLNKYLALELLPYFKDSPTLWHIVPKLTSLPNGNSFEENLLLLDKLSNQPIFEIIKNISNSKK